MKSRAPVFIVVLLLTVLAVPAFAAGPANYAVVKLGGYLPQANDVEDFDNSLYGELAVGRYFHPNIAGEFGIGYTKSDGSAGRDLTIVPLTFGVRGVLPMGSIEPFATLGVGLFYSELEAPGFSEDDTVFGIFAGAGVNYNFTGNMFLGVEAKYFLAEPSFGPDMEINGINLTANLGFRF